MWLRLFLLTLGIVPITLSAQAPFPPRVHLTFIPRTVSDSASAEEYRRIWAQNERRVVAALERQSGRRFITSAWADTAIVVEVLEAAAYSGYRQQPMRMRSSYPAHTKLATLIHELGHRLQTELFTRGEEEHTRVFLWLYDVWVTLEGQAWADRQVAFEKTRGQRYIEAWEAALALSPSERAARWLAFVTERQR